MAAQQGSQFHQQLKKVRRSLEQWRQARQGRRIPEDIWSQAVVIASLNGVAPVAKALNLDYYGLKDRVAKRGGGPEAALLSQAQETAAFFELMPPTPGCHLGRCSVEVESSGGARMRVRVDLVFVF